MLESEKYFKSAYKEKPLHVFECGGRFEILGNHTDHNHGLCLAATCDLSVEAAVSLSDDNKVYFHSKGHIPYCIDLSDLKVNKAEINMPSGIIRGVARYFFDHGYKIGGLKIAMTSCIPSGAGVSSSAAVEMCISKIFSYMFNGDELDNFFLAKCSQYAENEFFGKASGLLDQIGVGFGNISYIDFKDIDSPSVKTISNFFSEIEFVIVNSGSSHSSLSSLYEEIPNDMYSVAKKCGHKYLRDCSKKEIEDIKDKLSENEYNRAKHFFDENERVLKAIEAINHQDINLFFELINASRISSTLLLKNMMKGDSYESSPLEACDIAMKFLSGKGACKINGGGFGGSIVCALHKSDVNSFASYMTKRYGKKNVFKVKVNPFPVRKIK